MLLLTTLAALFAVPALAVAGTSPASSSSLLQLRDCPAVQQCGGTCMSSIDLECCPDSKTVCDPTKDFCAINVDTDTWSCCPYGELCDHGGGNGGNPSATVSGSVPLTSSGSSSPSTAPASASSAASGAATGASSSASPTSNGAYNVRKDGKDLMAAAGLMVGLAIVV